MMKAISSSSIRLIFLCSFLLCCVSSWGQVTGFEDLDRRATLRETSDELPQGYTINFTDVSIIEIIRFISRITDKNFIFDEQDLDFNVTIVSAEQTSVENILAALLQVLRINDLTMIEQGNNIIIHRNNKIKRPSRVVTDLGPIDAEENQFITRVYRLDFAEPLRVQEIIEPLVSPEAQIQVLEASRHIIVTDFSTNVQKITDLISSLDRPNTALDIGQYVAQNLALDSLVELAEKILRPIAGDTPLILTSQQATNSIFVISTPYFVSRSMTVLETLDVPFGRTRVLTFDEDRDEGRGRSGQSRSRERRSNQGIRGGPGRNGIDGSRGRSGSRGQSGASGLRGFGFNGRDGVDGTLGAPGINGINGAAGRDGLNGSNGFDGAVGRDGSFFSDGSNPGAGPLRRIRVDAQGRIIQEEVGAEVSVGVQSLSERGEEIFDELGDQIDDIFPEDEALFVNERGEVVDTEGTPIPQDDPRYQRFVRQHTEARGSFGNFRDPDDFQTPDLFFDFGGGVTESEFALPQAFDSDLPIGHIDTTHFYIHKLEYRKGDQIQQSFSAIADGLATSGTVNIDLLSCIASAQWIETSNSMIFTGTRAALDKVKELMRDIDTPLRQVFIEMLIIETTINNSLAFGVQAGSAVSQPSLGVNAGFYSAGSALASSFAEIAPDDIVDPSTLSQTGLSLGVIGKTITHGGEAFKSLGALVNALAQEADTNIIMNPKILTEDNAPAEIFVGTNERFRAESIAAEGSGTVNTNFEFRDVGSSLKVTPLLGTKDIITLDIEQEISSDATSEAGETGGSTSAEGALGPVTRLARTNTRVHIPDGHFLIISGMISEERSRNQSRIPCLGALPIIGHALGNTSNAVSKRNLMIFIRPKIIDTATEMRNLTRQQQDLFREKSRLRKREKSNYEASLDFLNIRCR